MDWTQTLTLILTINGSMLAALCIIHYIIKKDRKRYNAELAKERQEFAKTHVSWDETHALWADLLKQIHDIKLDQSEKTVKTKRELAS
jgi:hypothetical protein